MTSQRALKKALVGSHNSWFPGIHCQTTVQGHTALFWECIKTEGGLGPMIYEYQPSRDNLLLLSGSCSPVSIPVLRGKCPLVLQMWVYFSIPESWTCAFYSISFQFRAYYPVWLFQPLFYCFLNLIVMPMKLWFLTLLKGLPWTSIFSSTVDLPQFLFYSPWLLVNVWLFFFN